MNETGEKANRTVPHRNSIAHEYAGSLMLLIAHVADRPDAAYPTTGVE
jgi:hypothetical protein